MIITNNSIDKAEANFKELYEQFYDKVYRAAFRIIRDAHLAEDIMQETFIKAYHNLDTVMDLNKMGAWLSTIAFRTAVDLVRKEKRMKIILADDGMEYTINNSLNMDGINVEKEVEQQWLEKEIEQKIGHLSPNLRSVFLLKYKKGYKEEEIAALLQLPRGTVKSRLYRARQQLQTDINKEIIQIA